MRHFQREYQDNPDDRYRLFTDMRLLIDNPQCRNMKVLLTTRAGGKGQTARVFTISAKPRKVQ